MDDHKRLTLESDLGAKAQVSTEEIKGEMAGVANAMLREIGMNTNGMPETSEYIGSAAIHFYKPKGKIGYLHFQTQTSPMSQVPEVLADKGFTRLKGDLQVFYGRDRQTKRSGF
jgi:hypothetical protein